MHEWDAEFKVVEVQADAEIVGTLCRGDDVYTSTGQIQAEQWFVHWSCLIPEPEWKLKCAIQHTKVKEKLCTHFLSELQLNIA